MSYAQATTIRYLHRVQRYVLDGGERFATVVDDRGAPAYYPTALALSRRSRDISVETMAAEAADLVQVGLWSLRERIDLNARLEAGAYFDTVEIETLAEACGLKSRSLRKFTSRTLSEIRRGAALSKSDLVTNQQKSRRLTSALRYFEFVGRMSEVRLPKHSMERTDRVAARNEMSQLIKMYRPQMRCGLPPEKWSSLK